MKYKTIVYGATLKGLGIAACSPEDTLIIEPSGMVGHEFASALRMSHLHDRPLTQKFAVDLRNELTARNGVEQGRVYAPVLPAILMRLVQEYGLNIIFSSSLLSCRKLAAGEFQVTTLFQHQSVEYSCQRFIDTTTDFAKLDQYGISYTASISALIYNSASIPLTDSNSSLERIGAEPLWVMRLPVDVHQPFDAYRSLVFDHIKQLQQTYPSIKLLHIADTLHVLAFLDHIVQEEIGFYVPSCASHTILEAVEEGGHIGRM